jgi:peptidoglycan-N-acetylglucosamine deacetylase
VLVAATLGLLAIVVPTAQPVAPAAGPAVSPSAEPRLVATAARPVVLKDRQPLGRGRTVVLTFDDGPDPVWTPRVLDVLRRHDAVATFCVVSGQARKHEELLAEIVDAGMRLCNHTRTHPPDVTLVPADHQRAEIVGARADLADATDAPVGYFRAPGGHWSPPVLKLAADHGMQPLGWSVDLRDWERLGVPAMLATLEQHLHPGAVVLLHDGGGDRAQTVEALEIMLPRLVDEGYRFTFPTP